MLGWTYKRSCQFGLRWELRWSGLFLRSFLWGAALPMPVSAPIRLNSRVVEAGDGAAGGVLTQISVTEGHTGCWGKDMK